MSVDLTHISINGCLGGMSLGFERVNPGIKTVMFYETNKPCRYMLEHYWDVPVLPSVELLLKEIKSYVKGHVQTPAVDVVSARYRNEKDWAVIQQAIAAAKPRIVVIEGMASLRSRGLIGILQDLRTFGYDVEGHVIPACALGAVYKGERFWVIAHADIHGLEASREPEEGERGVGRQYITDDLLDEYRTWVERRAESSPRPIFDQPRILRRDDRFSRRVDSTRVRFLSDDVSPRVAGFVGFCLTRVIEKTYRELPMHEMSLVEHIHNAAKKTNLVVNTNVLTKAGVVFDKKNDGMHLIIRTKKGSVIDYWPSTDVWIVRKQKLRGRGVKDVVSGYATL